MSRWEGIGAGHIGLHIVCERDGIFVRIVCEGEYIGDGPAGGCVIGECVDGVIDHGMGHKLFLKPTDKILNCHC